MTDIFSSWIFTLQISPEGQKLFGSSALGSQSHPLGRHLHWTHSESAEQEALGSSAAGSQSHPGGKGGWHVQSYYCNYKVKNMIQEANNKWSHLANFICRTKAIWIFWTLITVTALWKALALDTLGVGWTGRVWIISCRVTVTPRGELGGTASWS